ncbi:ESCRT-III subunit protein [Hanseniaspora uvarum]|jgi:charged multivesicular body protein 4A/B|nr:ESCRT-III subunit protein [Hanseniaspora uvarum]
MWKSIWGPSAEDKQKKQKESTKSAIINLRGQIQLLTKKQTHLEQQIEELREKAKAYMVKKNTNMAKIQLKKSKILEGELTKSLQQVENLEMQLFTIENANLNLETVKAIGKANNAMKEINTSMNIDKVEDTMDEVRENMDMNEEISEALTRPIGGASSAYVDDEELEDELAGLMLEDETETLEKKVGSSVIENNKNTNSFLPNVPLSDLSSKQPAEDAEEEDEDELALRALQAEMDL